MLDHERNSSLLTIKDSGTVPAQTIRHFRSSELKKVRQAVRGIKSNPGQKSFGFD
jgi:hypothetical protein